MKNHPTLSRLNHWRTGHKRLADYLAYIAISLAIAAVLLRATINGASSDAVSGSFLFLLITVIVFTRFIKDSRRFWKQNAFWWLAVLLLLLHSGASFAVLKGVHPLPNGLPLLVLLTALLFLEPKLFQLVRNSILRHGKNHYLPE